MEVSRAGLARNVQAELEIVLLDEAGTNPNCRQSAHIAYAAKGSWIVEELGLAAINKARQDNIAAHWPEVAKAYAEIAAQRRASGRPIAEADCQIAAIARAMDAPIATRNVKDFDGCGIRIINPWNDQ